MLKLLALGLTLAAAQDFGQNHVVVRDFEWKIRSTEHFDIYYYDDSAPLVPLAAEVLEEGYARFTKALDIPTEAPPWAPSWVRKRWKWQRRPFFIYASPNDFKQSNVAFPGDGTGGITEPFKNRFMVYNDGSRQWFEEVTLHELVHVFQFHVLISGYWRSGAILKSIIYPLWMMEGMPGWLTYHVESALEETVIRDAATSGRLLPLTRLERFGHLKPHQVTLAYKQGAAALEFMSKQWGAKKPGQMLKLFENRFDTSSVLQEIIGLDSRQFDKKYREALEEKYGRERRQLGLKEPAAYGAALTKDSGKIPQFNSSPVFSPDGRWMYFLSTRYGHPAAVMRKNLRTGRTRRIFKLSQPRFENVPLGNFANLSRVLALSPDGRLLAFFGSRANRDGLYLYDTGTGRLERRELPGFQMATQPRFSPDGSKVAFSGMKETVTDIHLYDLASGSVSRLTDDPADDQMPAFTADGRAVVYSSEGGDPLGLDKHGRQLRKVDIASRASTLLLDLGGEARDPVLSADGRRVLFVREDGRFSELCEHDLETGKSVQLTRSLGGAFTPIYAPDGDVAFASLRRGSVHVFKGPRAGFESSPVSGKARIVRDTEKFLLPGMGAVERSTASAAVSAERPYTFDASTDLFLPAAFYSSVGGFFWTSYWQGSDMLGNHQATALVSVASGRAYDYAGRYTYLRYRPQLTAGVQGVGRRDLIESSTDLRVDDSVHSQFAAASYPFDRFHRAELLVGSISERLNYLTVDRDESRQARLATAALVRDTVRGRYLVATQGGRARLFATEAAEVLGGNRRYHTAGVEAHKFLHTGGQSALALRTVGAQSLGPHSPSLILGGLGGVRGLGRSTTRDSGNRLALANLEWRFPIAPDLDYYMWYIFPDFYFKAVFGSVFADYGYAWRQDSVLARARWRDARSSVGAGLKIYTFILQEFPLIVAFDYARRTTDDKKGIFYVYLGHLF